MPNYQKTTGIDGTVWKDGNKPRVKLDWNLKSVIGTVITLEIAKGELMYGKFYISTIIIEFQFIQRIWYICILQVYKSYNSINSTILQILQNFKNAIILHFYNYRSLISTKNSIFWHSTRLQILQLYKFYSSTHSLIRSPIEKNYSKLFGESLFETVKNYSHYSPMLNRRTIGGTIEINRQKLLKCSNYSPMLNCMCRRGRAYLK